MAMLTSSNKKKKQEKEEEEMDKQLVDFKHDCSPRFLDTSIVGETMTTDVDDDDDDDPSLTVERLLNTPEGRREARKYFQSQYEPNSLAYKYMSMIVSADRGQRCIIRTV